MRRQLEVLTLQFLSEDRNAVRAAAQELRFQSPMRRIESARQALDESERRIRVAEAHHLALEKGALAGWWKRLEALNPMEILGRGYAVVTRRADGVMIRRVSQARDGIRVRVSDGTFDADVASRRS
jgi:exodeoxyribonuclease VII large subunit